MGNTPISVTDPTDLRGAWHHVALLFDGMNRTLFRDAVFIATLPCPWQTSTLPVAIGVDIDNDAFAIGYTGGHG